SDRTPAVTVFWEKGDKFDERRLDPTSGELLRVRDTQGGDFFYGFHYSLHLGEGGIWIVGASAMVMLVALVTGLVIHHRIFKDFFAFRPHAASHRAWLDAHNLTSVLVLPFHFVISFTGLVIFWHHYIPVGMELLYGGNIGKAFAELEGHFEREPAQSPAGLIS